MESYLTAMPDPTLIETAYHEAGHAVAAWVQGLEVQYISIVPDEDASGSVVWKNELVGKKLDLLAGREWEDAKRYVGKLVIALKAGPAAQRRFSPCSWEPWQDHFDNEAITGYAFETFADDDAVEWLRALDTAVDAILHQHWAKVEALAYQLLERRTMRGREIHEFIEEVTTSSVLPGRSQAD